MVARTYYSLDNESLLIDASSPSGTAGNPIINNSDTPNGTIFEFQSGFSFQEIIIDDTGGDPDIFEDDQSGSHEILQGSGLVADGSAVESESIIELRALDALGNQTGPTITITVFSQGGSFSNIWGFGTSDVLVPGTRYVKTSGSNSGASAYSDFVTCFASGTMIRTPTGHRAVETLAAGDRVWTRRRADAPLRWVASSTVEARGKHAPVLLRCGAFGNNRDLLVSPQHRMLVRSAVVEMLFAEHEALVPAVHLVGLPGIERAPQASITYYHLLFEAHEIVDSNGCLTESFFPTQHSVSALDRATQREVLALFPDLAKDASAAAALCLTGQETRALRQALH